MSISVVYRYCCPKCGKDISNLDLAKGCCNRCSIESLWRPVTVVDILSKEVENVVNFFAKLTGFSPWTLQRYWIKRLVSGESFAMVAPTGVGKSTLLAVYAIYKAYYYRSKVYILTPTREIAKQMYGRICEFVERGGISGVKVAFYDSGSKNTALLKDSIRSGEFDILITSAAFLTRHQDLVMDKRFDVIIADDLDSIMKNSKSVDRILTLLGFAKEDVELAIRIVKLRQSMFVAKAVGGPEAIDKVRRELMELEAILRNSIAKKNVQLIVASATGRARGLKSQVLKLLLGFDAGAVFEYWRNIVDLYRPIDESLLDTVSSLVKRLGSGIVFVSPLYRDLLTPLVDKLRSEGIRVGLAKSGNRAVDMFRRGEVEVLVGTASYYGILVRGLDEPLRTRYTIFIGVPSIVRDAKDSLSNIRILFAVLRELRRLGYDVDDMLRTVVEIINSSTPSMLYLYSKILRYGLGSQQVSDDILNRVKRLIDLRDRAYELLKRILDSVGVIEISRSFVIAKRRERYITIKPDPFTYIQASGRCSRLLKGRKTFGLSIVFEEYTGLVSILENILKKYIGSFKFKEFSYGDLDGYLREIDRTRIESCGNGENLEISTALIVVESPTKVKTIANMFGKPAKRVLGSVYVYETLIPVTPTKILVASIASTLGHITDLVIDDGLHGVRIAGDSGIYTPVYDFISRCRSCGAQHVGVYDRCPYCESVDIATSSSIYNVLKTLALQVDIIFIATDPDTEGEKIAFDVYNLLLPYNRNIKRIEFREITKSAILEALRNPRDIDMKRVEAQIARRIADRWIGFEVSMRLQMRFDKPWLGAGRVQSPILLWVSSRYREYRENLGYAVVLDIGGRRIKVYIGRGIEAKEKAQRLAEKALREGLEIRSIETFDKEVAPPPPFTTDSLIQEANMLLGFSASKTMALAQALFELGLITYHRTDSTRLSALGISIAQEALKRLGLESMFNPRQWGGEEGGAHEAIRPTNPVNSEELVDMVMRGDIGFLTRMGKDHIKLYDIIFRRFVASQMPSAKIRYTRIRLALEDGVENVVEIPIEVVTPGFTLVYPVRLYPEVLKSIDIDRRSLKVSKALVVKSSTAPLYRVADIVKLMKEKGIGRPSTYAKAIDNNIRHGYIILSKKVKVLIPTRLGLEVASVLEKSFLDVVGEESTRRLEDLLDNIELGKVGLQQALDTIRSFIDSSIKSYEESLEHVASEHSIVAT